MKVGWLALIFGLGLSTLVLAGAPPKKAHGEAPEKKMNAIMVIHPYKHNGMWVFDDESRGLDKEPFVFGADAIIELAVKDIPNAGEGFNLIFSAIPFPGHQFSFQRREAEAGGYFYYSHQLDKKGWLCPALFKYFEKAPPMIYAQFKAAE
ncbi:MAG: DUF6717 family protein [Verrucomicrobiota bacterium]